MSSIPLFSTPSPSLVLRPSQFCLSLSLIVKRQQNRSIQQNGKNRNTIKSTKQTISWTRNKINREGEQISRNKHVCGSKRWFFMASLRLIFSYCSNTRHHTCPIHYLSHTHINIRTIIYCSLPHMEKSFNHTKSAKWI